MPMSVGSVPGASSAPRKPQPTPLRFGSTGPITELLPAEHLEAIQFVNQFQRHVITQPQTQLIPSNWLQYQGNMKQLEDVFKTKALFSEADQEKLSHLEDRHKQVLQQYGAFQKSVLDEIPDEISLGAAQNKASKSGKSENSKKSEKVAKVAEEEEEAEVDEDSDAIKDKELEKSVRADWTALENRSRGNVVKDYGKHYFTRGPVLSDSLWSLGIGAVLAIGSPVMTVTIPTTLAMFAAYRLCTAFVRFCQDPKGKSITKMYEDWIKKDLEKARKKAAG